MRPLFVSFFTATALLIAPALARGQNATPEQVDKAIKKAIAYLYSQQHDGNWEVVPKRTEDNHFHVRGWQWGGLSGIATCALRYAGEDPQEPRMKQAITWLTNADIWGIYALGFRCQVWAMVPLTPEIRKVAMRDKEYLLYAVYAPGSPKQDKDNLGFYPYYRDQTGKPGGDGGNWYDHSVSQYGILGMWAISQLNIEVPDAYWKLVDQAWRGHQYANGGWSYKLDLNKPEPTLAMTAAGLASLFITDEMIHSMDGLNCTGNIKDPNIEAALKWVSQNFQNYKASHPYYALYGSERVGVASGYKYFGKLNWYQEGANFLVSTQKDDGSWGNDEADHNEKRIPDTCFALMFLSRGRAPVMMNKLDWVPDTRGDRAKAASWNQRPRDVANIARWVGKSMEKDLNWQVVNLEAPVEDLHDAPILYISGKDSILFNDAQVAKLRKFVEQGGLIVGNADCGNLIFANSFKKLGSKLFPTYEFRELPADHPIFVHEQFKRERWRPAPFLQGLSNGSRELMLLFPKDDPAKMWQVRTFMGPNGEPLAQIMANMFLYAVDMKNLRNKGETYTIAANGSVKAEKKIKLARLKYAGNWDPEPGGWRRLAAYMHNQHKVDLEVSTVELGKGALKGYSVVHLTGTTKYKLTDAETAELKGFVAGGGTLVIDACGGSPAFALASEPQLSGMFSEARDMSILPANSPVYASGEKIESFEYRRWARKQLGNIRTPRLRGATMAGKLRIFFSPEDLSTGLVGEPVDGVYGYEPGTATSIMADILLYATK
jgi:hypothetical protein